MTRERIDHLEEDDKHYKVPELEQLKPSDKSIILISAQGAGSGSTTLAYEIQRKFKKTTSKQVDLILIGKRVRDMADMHNETSAAGFDKVPPVKDFDSQIYGDANQHNGPVIIEGKHETSVGPNFLSGRETDIYPINLYVNDFISATRVLRREGAQLADLVLYPEKIIAYLSMIQERNSHIKSQVQDFSSFHIESTKRRNKVDTSVYSPQEIANIMFGDNSWLYSAPEWEIDALVKVITQLKQLQLDPRIQLEFKDLPHYQTNILAVEYNLTQRLAITKNQVGLAEIRKEIKNRLLEATFALLIQKIPRFFTKHQQRDGDHEITIDECSRKWTPEYYKLANIWPTLKSMVKGKTIIDPFAGSGVLINVIQSLELPESVTLADLSYPGGHTLNHTGHFYNPKLNSDMIKVMFDELPSWYKPNFVDRNSLFTTHDAQKMPFENRQFDLVVSDPPYGDNLKDGGIEFFIETLPEILRVTKEGAILIIPKKWIPILLEQKMRFDLLVEDMSGGNSKKPTVMIFAPKN